MKIVKHETWFLDGDDWDFETSYSVINEGAGEMFRCDYDWGEHHCQNFIDDQAAEPTEAENDQRRKEWIARGDHRDVDSCPPRPEHEP